MLTKETTKLRELKRALKLMAMADEILFQDSNYVSRFESEEANKSSLEAKLKLGRAYNELQWTIEALENNF